MSSLENNPLFYFDNLLERNKLKELKDIAVDLIVEQYGDLIIEPIDYDKGIVTYKTFRPLTLDVSIDSIEAYNFSKEFPQEVFKEAEKAKNNIDSIAFEINKNGNNANEHLLSQIKHLNSLIDKSKTTYPKLKFIENTIEDLIVYLVDRYSLKESYKKRILNINIKSSFFDVKSTVKRSLLEELYDISIDLEIIDEEIVSEETFINVLTLNPITSQEVIIFKCNNELAAHLINCIQPLFNNLSTSQINRSKSFINKNGKTLNQADLDNANKRLRRKSSAIIERVTNHISRLLKT